MTVKSNKMKESSVGYRDQYDLKDELKRGCRRYLCQKDAIVEKDFELDDFMKSMKHPVSKRKTSIVHSTSTPLMAASKVNTETEEDTPLTRSKTNQDSVIITAIYDYKNRLSEIRLNKQSVVPRVVMQLFGLLAPHYSRLIKMTFKSCRLDGYTIYEMTKFLPLCMITQLCLDDSRLPESSFAVLLDEPSRITCLSLCRCRINDNDCIDIISRLRYSNFAKPHLITLNLSSNQITDVGANSIGEALRTNRSLRYLNLSDNKIGDIGANSIFCALAKFPLTLEDIIDRRRSYFKFSKAKHEAYCNYFADYYRKSVDDSVLSAKPLNNKKIKKSKLFEDVSFVKSAKSKAGMFIKEVFGEFCHPFNTKYTQMLDAYSQCFGNMVLCYLNISYNNLSYFSVDKLRSTLICQKDSKKLGETGLLKVMLEGNPVPAECDAYRDILDLLKISLAAAATAIAHKKYTTK